MIVYDVKKYLDIYSLFANTRRSGKGKNITGKMQATVTHKNHEVNLHLHAICKMTNIQDIHHTDNKSQ